MGKGEFAPRSQAAIVYSWTAQLHLVLRLRIRPTEVLRNREFRNKKLLESTGANFTIKGLQNQ